MQFFDQVTYLVVLPNATLKDADDIQIRYSTSEIAVPCRKQTQMHLCSVLTCSKKHSIPCLFHANTCLPIMEQIHTDRLVWNGYELPIMPTELCTTYSEM